LPAPTYDTHPLSAASEKKGDRARHVIDVGGRGWDVGKKGRKENRWNGACEGGGYQDFDFEDVEDVSHISFVDTTPSAYAGGCMERSDLGHAKENGETLATAAGNIYVRILHTVISIHVCVFLYIDVCVYTHAHTHKRSLTH